MAQTGSSSSWPATILRVLRTLGGCAVGEPVRPNYHQVVLIDDSRARLHTLISENCAGKPSRGSARNTQPDSCRDSSARMSAALRRWSVEDERAIWPPTPAAPMDSPLTVTPHVAVASDPGVDA